MPSTDSVTTLYNGKHTVVFKNGSHRYLVDDEYKPGVTTALGAVLAKPALIQWAVDECLKALRPKLPSITLSDLDEARFAHARRKDSGANTGTVVHELVEMKLQGKPYYLDDYTDDVVLAMDGFETWYKNAKPETLAVEQVVYSEDYDYCGTFDSILKINGKNYLCDLKTTNASKEAPDGVYGENFIQLGAYAFAYEEQRQYELETGGTKLVELDGLAIISAKKNGITDFVTNEQLRFSVEEAIGLWTNVWVLYNELASLRQGLNRKRAGIVL